MTEISYYQSTTSSKIRTKYKEFISSNLFGIIQEFTVGIIFIFEWTVKKFLFFHKSKILLNTKPQNSRVKYLKHTKIINYYYFIFHFEDYS